MIDRVVIVMPARDERDTIGDSLAAVGRAVDGAGPVVACSITVVDDGSSDGTGQIARRALARLDLRAQVVRVNVGRVGTARRIGVHVTTATWRSPERVWILSTDADSRVRPDWIVRHVAHAQNGAVAVSGIVDLIEGVDVARFRSRWRSDYGARIADDHRHPYAHATNLGVRLDAYRAVGGFRDVAGEEDGDLWSRLRARGIEPLSDARIVVDTSGRCHGRVAEGFAHALGTLYAPPAPVPD